jgi:hypothetical protein
MFAVCLLCALAAVNEATQLRTSRAPKDAIGEIASHLKPGFNLEAADADGNGSVTWKELYDALAKFKIPDLDTGVVKGLVKKFAKTGPKEGAEGGLDKAEFAKMIAYFKKMSADALIPKNPDAFDTGCYDEEDKGETYRGLVTSTTSGRTCQKWLDDKPHDVGMKASSDNGLGNHNFCRNPDGSEEKPWCFTQDPGVEREVCNVPVCPGLDRDYIDEADTLSKKIAEGLECDCAAQLYGSSTTTADTAVLLSWVERKEQFNKKCKKYCAKHGHKIKHLKH